MKQTKPCLHQVNHPQRLRIGPATLLAAAAGICLLYGHVIRTQSSDSLGTAALNTGASEGSADILAYEADASGHLQHIAATTQPSLRRPSLFKPEVDLLLEYESQLSLQSEQRTKLKMLNREWRRQKGAMERQIERSEKGAQLLLKVQAPNQNASPAMIASSFSDYSALSALYDQRRAIFWQKAFRLLTAAQVQQFDSIRKSATGGRGGAPISMDTKGVSRR